MTISGSSESVGEPDGGTDRDAETEAFLARLRRAPPPAEAADHPVVPGVTILHTVARGGMGVVFRGRDETTGADVAVKVLRGLEGMTDEVLLRARREGEILARLDHPNIVRVLRCEVCTPHPGAGPVPAIVMEWVGGGTLEHCSGSERLEPVEAAGVVRDLARAVAEVHALGVVHRDIKPANVLLMPRLRAGDHPVAKLADFGVARRDRVETRLTREGAVVGTPGYLAPEQAGIDPTFADVGPSTDIHGLGAVLYWLLADRAPYEARTTAATLQLAARGESKPLSNVAPRLPRDLVTIVEKCLAHRPSRRYRSAGALADDLDRYLAHRPIHARRAGVGERLAKWARCHPARAATVVTATVALIGLVANSVQYVRGLERANVAITASRDRAREAEELARRSFDRLTDDAAGRLIDRGNALDEADRDHLRRIRDQYIAWPLASDEGSGLRFRAAGLDRLARIFLRLNWFEDAIESVRASIACFADLESRGLSTPTDDASRLDLELLECGLLIGAGRLDEAATAASATIERLDRESASRPELARHLPGALSGLAIVEGQRGNGERAQLHFRRAIELCDRLLAGNPDDVGMLELALPVYFNVASTPSNAAGADERHALLARVAALAEDGLGKFDSRREFIGSSALMALYAMADIDLERGRATEALATVRREAALARSLAAEMPDSEPIASAAMMVANQAFRCHEALGRPGDAEKDLAEAIDAASRAVAAEPALISRARVLTWLLESQGTMYRAIGDRDRSIASLQHLLQALGPWVEGPGADAQLVAKAEEVRERIARLMAGESPDPSEGEPPTAPPPRADLGEDG